MVRKIQAKQVVLLRAQGMSGRAISTSQGISRNSVAEVLEAVDRLELTWDDLKDKPEGEVYGLLFPGRGAHETVFVQPDWAQVHSQLAKVGVTLKLLHGEYVDTHGGKGGAVMSYDRFCKTYQHHVTQTSAASRVEHKAGVSVEVDWSGPTMKLVDPVTGLTQIVYLFVACLPFSRYAFVEATLDMKQDSWMRAHVAMFEDMGGTVPRIVPDNLKTGVIKHPKHGEVILNDAYRHLAAHYGAAVLPARIRKAKDKPSVENTVGHVATSVIASLRDQKFTTLGQLRAAIKVQMAEYNREPFQKRAGSRLSVFAADEQPLLGPLPAVAYEISTWFYGRKVAKNSYVAFKRNYYSVPIAHIGSLVDLRITDTMMEIYKSQERLTSHLLLGPEILNQYQTNTADIPTERTWQAWDPDRVREWAQRTGPSTSEVIDRVFKSVAVPEQGLNATLAILRLGRRYGPDRLEAACQIALSSSIRSPRYAHIHPILETGQDKLSAQKEEQTPVDQGGYVRGAAYYSRGQR